MSNSTSEIGDDDSETVQINLRLSQAFLDDIGTT